MINFTKTMSSIIALLLLAMTYGCNNEKEKTAYLCATADRKDVDGTPGVLDVFRVDNGNTIKLGYSWSAQLVLHSECAPAYTEISGTNHYFEWYRHGVITENNSVVSLNFSTNNFGKEQIEATRKDLPGNAITEFAEKIWTLIVQHEYLSEFGAQSFLLTKSLLSITLTMRVLSLLQLNSLTPVKRSGSIPTRSNLTAYTETVWPTISISVAAVRIHWITFTLAKASH